MKELITGTRRAVHKGLPRWTSLAMSAVFVWALVGVGFGNGGALASSAASDSVVAPTVTCPGGQCFEDVPPSNTFYAFINALYEDNIISGYPCGGANEPCVPPDNRPYYRSGNPVTRGQMSKFVDNGRRNIADAIGTRLVLTNPLQVALVVSSTTTDSIDASNASGAEAIQAICTRAGQNCWAFYSSAASGDYAGVFNGGRGVSVTSSNDNYAAVDANTSATSSYAVDGYSADYRSVRARNDNTSWYGLYVDTSGSTVGAYVNGNAWIQGNLTVTGSKTGYVVDIMQNADGANLQPGDVVTIVGSSSAVLGDIPVVMVRKASSAYDTGVVGIVDQALYVPDAKTKAAYLAEQQAQKDVLARRRLAQAQADAMGIKFDPDSVPMPPITISDKDGTIHAADGVTDIASSGYANVVTLGSYKGVKVDASFGAIKAGDLLVSSPNPGYAMKATDMSKTTGTVIGKALGDLANGTGVVPVMVTLK